MRIFGKYRLHELLASGGMADVWRAEVTGAAGVVKEVALKLVRGEHAASSEFVRMFIEEARLAARLGHANVVQVFEFDQVDGRYYIAMELVRGHHLGRVVERARELGLRLGLPRAVHLGAEIARALAHAHRAAEGGRPLGIVHRDVSPHNVLVSFEGEVKLADFGIARAMGQAGLTAPGTVKGKVAYMAPEQGRGEALDARADLFALGVVLWELCTGRRLFARESEGATLAALLSDAPLSPPSAWNEAVPPRLDAAVLGLLERDRARRTASGDEVAAELAGILLEVTRSPDEVDLRAFMARLWPEGPSPAGAPEPTRVRSPSPAPGRTPVPADPAGRLAGPERTGERETRTSPVTRRSRLGRRLALAAALVLAGVTAAVVLRGSTGPEGAPARPAEASLAAPQPEPAPPTPTTGVPSTPEPHPPQEEQLGRMLVEEGVRSDSPEVNRTETRAGAPKPAPPARKRPLQVSAREPRMGGLAVPPASSGEGILAVSAAPWGTVFVDGEKLGDTPLELRVPAGRYRVRVAHESFGKAERTVRVGAGERVLFNPTLPKK